MQQNNKQSECEREFEYECETESYRIESERIGDRQSQVKSSWAKLSERCSADTTARHDNKYYNKTKFLKEYKNFV